MGTTPLHQLVAAVSCMATQPTVRQLCSRQLSNECYFSRINIIAAVNLLYVITVYVARKCVTGIAVYQAEADLGMFSMFGRTGAPTKRGPPQKHKKNHFFATW